ncbi:pfs ankyrin repeats & 6-phosphofructo-2-kinase, partial [Fusarium mundagurra]
MAKHGLFIIYAVAFVGVNADDLSDFSNNLATDIGPLLALFGDSMTRQYLSESTYYLDYFIFAMAPIGIITAIISAIRVCGHPSLRAFIGRSQEGDGVVEAELCTSTSRDVCELFNKGGITRVLGRPNILELIHVPPCGGPEEQNPSPGADKTGLFLFRHYLETHKEPDTSGWTRVPAPLFENSDEQASATPFAPKPNLSLNVGIKKQPDCVFFIVAAVGFVLQAGVLALAAVGVWIFRWNLNDAGTPATRDYAPAMFIAGTVLMCGGMWSCAALIGQTTHELRYQRKRASPAPQSRLLWLQPGPQVIGDQSFDPFAYFDKEDDPLLCWTSSKKDLNKKFEVYTFIAVSAVLAGYIFQFIGLRGMKAWVSLAQLGITIVMSILRGLLRMQRLSRHDNELEEMPDLVAGHELDWLAFEIARQESQKGSFWHITGQHEKAKEADTQNKDLTKEAQFDGNGDCNSNGNFAPICTPQSPAMPGENQGSRVDCKDLLPIRVRLAHLTGHKSLNNIREAEYQKWKDDDVKVRMRARKLSAAIEQASQSLFQKSRPKGDITLRVKAITSPDPSDTVKHNEQLIGVVLKPPPDPTQTNWSIDAARIEAILGLWM